MSKNFNEMNEAEQAEYLADLEKRESDVESKEAEQAEKETSLTAREQAISDAQLKKEEQSFAQKLKAEKKVKISIHETAGIQNPYPVGINGVQFAIPVGKTKNEKNEDGFVSKEIVSEVPKTVYDFLKTIDGLVVSKH